MERFLPFNTEEQSLCSPDRRARLGRVTADSSVTNSYFAFCVFSLTWGMCHHGNRFARPFRIARFSELAPTSEQLRDGWSVRDACEVNEAPLCCESVPRLYQSTPETRGGQQTGSLLSMRRLARPGHHLAADGRI